jgi:Protein of unknown function (DUF1592)/Protein of unknown function (DUF1595)/Protein of unknown function (DUF1588)/Protein of unknown function (DUF1585)/Protein of unknown function (DUF1587)
MIQVRLHDPRFGALACLIVAVPMLACSGNISSGSPGGEGGDRAGGSAGSGNGGNNKTGGTNNTGGVSTPDCPTDLLPFSFEAVRLTDVQYRNTIASLFSFPIDIGTKYPTSSSRYAFTSFAAANDVLYADLQNILETSESIALQAVDKIAQVVSCTPTGDGVACARTFLQGFLPRAYRRPVQTAEIDHLIALYSAVRAGTEPLDFNLAIAAVLVSVLQSPQFLYRVDIGTPGDTPGLLKLDGFEVASRLSYLFWDAPPDDMLKARAGNGDLDKKDVLVSEAERLLADPRGRTTVARFFSEWMGASGKVFADRVAAPIAASFAPEFNRFVTDAVFDADADIGALVSAGHTFANKSLQQHYGLPVTARDDNDWLRVELPAKLRAGVLSKAQVAASHAHTGDTSVILRGNFALGRLTCFDVGLPPAGAAAMNPVLPATATARDRIEARSAIALCKSCHSAMDWMGYGMEDLDQVGRVRDTYQGNGTPVDAAGIAVPFDDAPFTGTAGLASLLAANAEATGACLATQWYRFATAHTENDEETQCHVGALNKAFADSNYNLKALLVGIARSDAMLFRKEVK